MLRRVRLHHAWIALSLLGCAHSDAFAPADNQTATPFIAGEPTRLTYNPGADMVPAWLPDGSAIVYAFDHDDPPHDEPDRCLGVLPPTGGRRTRELCSISLRAADSVDRFDEPSVLPDGRVAYVRSARAAQQRSMAYVRLVIGSPDPAVSPTDVIVHPYVGADGALRDALTYLHWISSTEAIGVAGVRSDCHDCPAMALVGGRELVRLAISAEPPSTASLTLLTTDDSLTSATVAPGESAAYFTRLGDSRVYRIALSGGTPTVAVDFGPAGVARDIQVRGATLYAVVGGNVRTANVQASGNTQIDDGGPIYVADLGTGATHPLVTSQPRLAFRRLALAPSGATLLAQAAQEGLNAVGSPDIWRIGRP
jgi:hypothetical protein